jgi:Predicted transcriptional regulators
MKDLVKLGHQLVRDLPDGNKNFFSLESAMGELIFALRMKNDLTQSDLARKAEVGLKTIIRVEGGSLPVSSSTYTKILRALNADIRDLVTTLSESKVQASQNKKNFIRA